jgi:hypothetical protein
MNTKMRIPREPHTRGSMYFSYMLKLVSITNLSLTRFNTIFTLLLNDRFHLGSS